MYLYGVYIMLQSRITLMDEIKTFLCGHYHIILLVELLNIYIYFISLFSISSRWVGGGGGESVGGGGCLPALYMSYCTSLLLRNWKSTGKDFSLGGGYKGKRATISLHGHCVYRSALKILGCFCFSVSGKGEMFFAVIKNTLLAD